MTNDNKNLPLLIFCEDDDEDWILISDVLERDCQNQIRYERVKDGEVLMDRLRDNSKPLPSLILLDLKMPKKDGAESLKEIREDMGLKHIPVIILTTSKLESDIFKSYHGGANSYIVKPVDFPDMAEALKSMHHYWTEVATIPSPSTIHPTF